MIGARVGVWAPDSWTPPFEGEAKVEVFWAAEYLRLDNRRDLARTLSLPQSSGIKTLLTEAYSKWGQAMAERLEGDFAFVLWDGAARKLFGARDTAGACPCYYHHDPATGCFAVASSIQQLLEVPGIPAELDDSMVAANLRQLYFQNERTWFRDLRKLPAGHCLTIEPGRCVARRFWSPQDAPRIRLKSDDEYAEGLLETIRTAVARRTRDLTGVGIHVSGGLDSACIAGLTAEQRPAAFCWQPPPPQFGDPTEFEMIDAVAKRHGLKVRYCPPSVDDVLEDWERDPATTPFSGRSTNEWPIQKLAASLGVSTMISGFGGDEAASYSGNGFYENLLLSGRWTSLAKLARRHKSRPARFLLSLVRNSVEAAFVPGSWQRRMNWADNTHLPVGKAISRLVLGDRVFKAPEVLDAELTPYFSEEFRRSVEPAPLRPAIRRPSIRSAQEQLLASPHTRNIIEAWNGSGNPLGINYTFPLMDKNVVEFALGLPPEQIFDGAQDRRVFRSAISSFTPESVCYQPIKIHDPQRCDAALASMLGAFAKVRERLLARAVPPSRARYLDMPRLMRDLEPENLAKRQKWPKLVWAVKFLDF